ncbi:MAG TPA: RNA methyltransferase [Streptosporangiaceae bacterium]|nr:RNA methyltransferase [Streptosporangiaceae bacterium]
MAEVISSAANPLIKRVRLLADRKHRRREGAFVVQGIQPVWQAVEAGADIETLIVAPELLRPAVAAAMVTRQEELGMPVARVSGTLFARIADREGPAGLAAIVRARPRPLAGLQVRAGSLFVALHEVGNPGNLGTIIRTASAAGAAGVILVGQTTDPYDPAAVKASMGAIFDVPVASAATAAEFLDWSAGHDITVAAATARAEQSCWDIDFPLPLAVLLGSEGDGLPPALLDHLGQHGAGQHGAGQHGAGRLVRIPMAGTAESLNLAVAAGILLYEVRRRTGLPGDGPPAPAGSRPGRL